MREHSGTLVYEFKPTWLRGDGLNVSERQDRLAALLRTLMEAQIEEQGVNDMWGGINVSEVAASTAGVRVVLSFSDGYEARALRRLADLLERSEAVEVLGVVD